MAKIDVEDFIKEIVSGGDIDDLSYSDKEFEISVNLGDESQITISDKNDTASFVLNKIENPSKEDFEIMIERLKELDKKLDNFRSSWQKTMNDSVDSKIELENIMQFVPEGSRKFYRIFVKIFSKVANVLMHGKRAQSFEKSSTNMLVSIALNIRLEKDFLSLGEYYKDIEVDTSLHKQKNELIKMVSDVSANFRFIHNAIMNNLKASMSVYEIIGA